MRYFLTIPGYLLFWSMLLVPAMYPLERGALLAYVLLGIFCWWFTREGKLGVSPQLGLWSLVFAAVGAIFMTTGAVNGTPGAFRVGTVYVVWPIVFTILVGPLHRRDDLVFFSRTLIAAGIVIPLYVFAYILSDTGYIPSWLFPNLGGENVFGSYEGYTEFQVDASNALFFILPFVICAVLEWRQGKRRLLNPWVLYAALALSFVAVLLNGRRALWLLVPLVPFIYLGILAATGRFAERLKTILRPLIWGSAVVAAGLAIAFVQADLKWDAIAESALSVFDSSGDVSTYIRQEQAAALIAGWRDSPLIGHGLGGSVFQVIRDPLAPWSYELSYHALLFHVGIVGVAAYSLLMLWIYWQGLKIIKVDDELAPIMIPALVGLTGFLLGNATNPYLEKFDYMWVIFFPLAIINAWFLKRRAQRK